MPEKPSQRLILALDYDRLAPALRLARRLYPRISFFKIGSQLFTSEGPEAIRRVAALGRGVRIFLDLKFHDIPNTVAGAVAAAAELPGVRMVNVHALGGPEMMRAAAEALRGRRNPPLLLAVTVLTSMDAAQLRRVGVTGPPAKRVLKLAKLAQSAGVDGVVASPQEVAAIRKACGRKFVVVTPGIRPASAARDDQSRIATPAQAIRSGADYLVVGRPITAAPDPLAAAEAIFQEVASTQH